MDKSRGNGEKVVGESHVGQKKCSREGRAERIERMWEWGEPYRAEGMFEGG